MAHSASRILTEPEVLGSEPWFKLDFGSAFAACFDSAAPGGPTASMEAPAFFAAPARINLIGEHIDYNGGKVFPAALDRCLFVAIRGRADNLIRVRSLQQDARYDRRLMPDASVQPAETADQGEANFAPYLDGVLAGLAEHGARLEHGFDALLFSTVPMGAGVSSSAALELGFGTAVLSLTGRELSPLDLALIGQKAEHQWAGVHCGIMDQFAVAFGRAGQAILLDTDSLDYRYVPLALGQYCIILMNSNVPRSLAGSKYNERRAECQRGLAVLGPILGVDNLCAISPEAFAAVADRLEDPLVLRRVRHCVSENQRVLESVAALEAGRLDRFGALMSESHRSLRDDYQVSGPALDALFDAAKAHPACLGARMTGAGFGGCAIALVERQAAADFIASVDEAYRQASGYRADFYVTTIGDGARQL